MGRRSDHSRDQIREMALQAAARLVAKEGTQGLSARKVAAAIGYTVGSLYLVFRNLDDLVLQLNARTLDAIHQAIEEAGRQCDDPGARLLAFGRAYLRFAVAQPHRWRLVFEHRMQQDAPLPDWYVQHIDRLFALIEVAVGALLMRQNRGGSPESPALAARALWSGVHGVCILSVTGKLDVVRVESARALLDHLIQTYLAGLEAEAL